VDTNNNLEAPPAPALRIRLLNLFVRIFPRRFFVFFRACTDAKFSFHPLLLCRKMSPTNSNLPSNYRFDLLNDHWLNTIISHKDALSAEVYRNRLVKGDCCYCLEADGELVAYQWITRDSCCIFRGMNHEIDFLPLTSTQAFTYDFYTYRTHRNKGYGSLLKKQVYKALSACGVNEVMSCVLSNNRESRNIHLREGFSLKALPHNYRIMNWTTTLWGNEAKVKETAAWLSGISATLRTET
jgi:GNAT superfamily N-acetyltransferase